MGEAITRGDGLEQTTLAKLLSEWQLADRWNATPRMLQAQRLRGDGPLFVKIGRLVRYRLADVIRFEQDQLRRSTSE
jgi:hypothetical protein